MKLTEINTPQNGNINILVSGARLVICGLRLLLEYETNTIVVKPQHDRVNKQRSSNIQDTKHFTRYG